MSRNQEQYIVKTSLQIIALNQYIRTMKLTLINFCTAIALTAILLSMKADNGKRDLLCHKWIQVAFKRNSETAPTPVDRSMAKTCVFNPDGGYVELMGMKASGHYFLNATQTKIAFQYEMINGKAFTLSGDTTKHYNYIILKLTKDSLIYGQEALYGEQRVYGHDDWYFVRKD